jgi:hypothetical protein
MGGERTRLLPDYTVRILDGNALAATEHRLGSAPLPGKSLVVLDPDLGLAVDIFPCEDGHAQERRLFGQVLATVAPGQLWIADRNMCTLEFLTGIAGRQSAFVIREHQNLPSQAVSSLRSMAVIEAGEVFEQAVTIEYEGNNLTLRRIVLRLSKPTRHGNNEIVVSTHLPITDASATVVLELYRERLQVEGLFLSVTQNFECEIEALAYPKAALFSFSLALVTYNILATLKVALASMYGVETIETKVSDFYLVDELQGTYRGMMIAIPPQHLQQFRTLSLAEFALLLKQLAAEVDLKRFLKQPRNRKSKTPPRVRAPKHPHVSTARLLCPG